MKRVGMEGCSAVAEAVKLARADVVAAYPITPQSHIAERLAEMVANGELDADYIPVESEHSAMSACLGSSAVGSRTFTATAGQGLELMHEVLYVASSLRLPIVMVVTNRALSGPLNVWGDHSDVMATRDCGWIQVFAENVQQAFDLTLCAFRIGEDQKVLFPVMVHIDGFHLSHVVESLCLVEQEKVDKFLPPYHHPYALNPDKPVTMGAYAAPNYYTEARKSQDVALRAAHTTILRVWEEFGKITGRSYSPVESYESQDAEVLLVAQGSYSETAMLAIDKLRAAGHRVGLIRLRLWRPFPLNELRRSVAKAQLLVVLDRAFSYGGPAPLCSEVQAALCPLATRPKVVSFVGGLGGRDISTETFEEMILRGIDRGRQGELDELEVIGVRE